jgi:hypothetical protein
MNRWLLLALAWVPLACSSPPPDSLYPLHSQRDAAYLCRIPYTETYDQNQAWTRARPVLVIVHDSRATVYFENDQTQQVPLEPGMVIPSGSYACPR